MFTFFLNLDVSKQQIHILRLAMVTNPLKICVVGCGLTGSTTVSRILANCGAAPSVEIDIFDQGYSPGGRLSSRTLNRGTDDEIVVDHGCQFLRSDTTVTSDLLSVWKSLGWLSEWKPRNPLEAETSSLSSSSLPSSFFGFPSKPPFYHPTGPTGHSGISSLVLNQVSSWDEVNIKILLLLPRLHY